MGYYDNLPSFKPVVDPQSFGGARMSPEDRATMNMRMERAVPDAVPPNPNMPMPRFPADWRRGPAIPTRAPAITPGPLTAYRDTPPPLGVEPPQNFYGPAPAVMEPKFSQPNAMISAAGDIASKTFLPYVQSAITNAQQGNYMRAAGAGVGALKQAVWDAPVSVLSGAAEPVKTAASEFRAGYGNGSYPSFKEAFSKYAPAMPAAASVAPANSAPTAASAAQPATVPGVKTVATPAGNQQRLSEQYPSYFKSPPKFSDAVGGAAGYKLPLTAAEQNYNAQVQRGMELENRKRELMNGLIYRSTQLHDPNAFRTLKELNGGGQMLHAPLREEMNPEYRYNVNAEKYNAGDKLNAVGEVQSKMMSALGGDDSIPVSQRIRNARSYWPTFLAALKSNGVDVSGMDFNQFLEEQVGAKWNPKGYYDVAK